MADRGQKKVVEIVAWGSNGDMIVLLGSTRYRYYGVPSFQYHKLKSLLREKNLKEFFKILKQYRRPYGDGQRPETTEGV